MHALIEKPLAHGRRVGARRLAEAFDGAGPGRRGRAHRALQPGAAAGRGRGSRHGELGEIYQIATRRQGPFPARIADVGVVMDLATHDIDLTAWVTQQPFASVVGAHRAPSPAASTRTWSRSSASSPTAP